VGYDARSLRARSGLVHCQLVRASTGIFWPRKCGTIFGPKIALLVYNYKMFIDFIFFGLWMFMDVYGVYDFDTSQLDGVSK